MSMSMAASSTGLPLGKQHGKQMAQSKPRWADFDDSPTAHGEVDGFCDFTESSRPARACAHSMSTDAEDDRSTTASLEGMKERVAEVASDEEQSPSAHRDGDWYEPHNAQSYAEWDWSESRAWQKRGRASSSSWWPKAAGTASASWAAADWSQSSPTSSSWRSRQDDASTVQRHKTDSKACGSGWGQSRAQSDKKWQAAAATTAKKQIWSQQTSSGGGKCQCQFTIGIAEERNFQVKRKLLGPGGEHMKRIAEETEAKLRLRGKGSGFKEGPEQEESADPLMLCVSAKDTHGYEAAKRMISALLVDTYDRYREFCAHKGRPVPDLQINMHEGARDGSY